LKNFLFFFIAINCLFLSLAVIAQEKPAPAIKRCATMERLELDLQQNPRLRAPQGTGTTPSQSQANTEYRTLAVVTIPVVVHIVLANPFIITDADVQAQIDRLNLDFSGLNPDSTNAPPGFMAVRGHSLIQFTLARRTPSGQLTNGIERKSGTGSNVNAAVDPIKRAALGGLDAWNSSSYLNLWVGQDLSGLNLLGYAQFPNSGTAADDGVFLNFQGFGSNPCYTFSSYNKGRTGSHEIGHYLGLYHIWGDESGCTGDDFRQLPGSGCFLPTGMFNPAGQGNTASDIGDTPNQAGSTTNCPGGNVTDACSTTSPGKMYQDFMDYTADACYSMFTNKQVQRMEWVIDNCRAGLKTSLGATPPAGAISLDVSPLESVNPGGFELSGCSIVTYPAGLNCAGSLAPKFRLVNNGVTTITSVGVGYRFNNGTAITQTINVNLATGSTAVVSFPSFTAPLGNHQFKFFTFNPNGGTDQVPANDTLQQSFIISGVASLPITETFESTAFPPGTWTVNNPNGDSTWRRIIPGKASNGAMFINNFVHDERDHIDDFKSQPVSVNGATSLLLTFDVAHQFFGTSGTSWDTLSVLVSGDCGVTYQNVYKKFGPALSTAGGPSGNISYLNPLPSEWRTESVVLSGAVLSTGQVQVVFRNTSRFGNNIFIDNINVAPFTSVTRNTQLVSVNSPKPLECGTSVTPSVTIKNLSSENITGIKLSYSIDNGAVQTTPVTNLNLAFNASTDISLGAGTVSAGVHNIKVYSWEPVSASGTGDSNTSNDTLQKQFSIPGAVQAPLVENFTATTFPPSNWALINPDGSIGWTRHINGNVNTGSAWVNTFNYGATGALDDLVTPSVSYSVVDSVKLSFDLSAGLRNTVNTDTLSVLITKDCGNTFTEVYKKGGEQLLDDFVTQTTEFFPSIGRWRTEVVDLTAFVNQSPVMAIFRLKNKNGNNIFIDNVNISTVTLPAALRQQGYLILPTVFKSSFTVWHYQQPIDLKYVSVYNAIGQLVWQQQFDGNAGRMISIDLSGKAPGVYIVKLGYSDEKKNVRQRVIRQ
jgi:hypothetical protein